MTTTTAAPTYTTWTWTTGAATQPASQASGEKANGRLLVCCPYPLRCPPPPPYPVRMRSRKFTMYVGISIFPERMF
jgi:hypothetical protein